MTERAAAFTNLKESLDTGGRCLVLGGPSTGKSHTFREWAEANPFQNWDDVVHVETASELSPFDDNTLVILDDFYTVFTEVTEDGSEATVANFKRLLLRDGGLCIATRPRSFDWVLSSGNLGGESFEEWLRTQSSSDNPLKDFTVHQIQYDKETAINLCCDFADDIDREELSQDSRSIKYTYPQEETLSDHIVAAFDDEANKYETYIPFLALEAAALNTDQGLVPELVTDHFEDFLAELGTDIGTMNEFITSVQSHITGFLDQVPSGSSLLGSSLIQGAHIAGMGAVPVVGIGGSLVLWSVFREDTEATARAEVESFFGQLLGDEMLPHTRETLEEELGLPPMTIESLQFWSRPHNMRRIERFVETSDEFEAELDALQDDIESLESKFTAELTALTESIETLEETVGELYAFHSANLREAVSDVSYLETERTELARLLSIEFGYTEADADIVASRLFDKPIREESITDMFGAGDGSTEPVGLKSGVVVVRGPPSVGKTSYIYHACGELARRGYATGRFNREAGIEFVRTRLETMRDDQDRVALYCEYDQTAGWTPEEFRRIFAEELDGLWDILLVECQSFEYTDLKRAWVGLSETSRAEIRRNKRIEPVDGCCSLDPLSDDQLEAIPDAFGFEGDVVDNVVAVSDGYPSVALEACLLIIDGQDIVGYSQFDVLTRRLRGSMYPRLEAESYPFNPKRVFRTLGVANRIQGESVDDAIETLLDLAGVDKSVHGEAIDICRGDNQSSPFSLERYIRIDTSRNEIKLFNEIYSQILFEDVWFGLDEWRRQQARDDYLSRLEATYPDGFVACAVHLRRLWTGIPNLSEEERITQNRTLVMDAMMELLEYVDSPYHYAACLANVAGTVPISPSQINQDLFFGGLASDRSRTEQRRLAEPVVIGLTTLSHIAALELVNGDHGAVDTVESIVASLLDRLDEIVEDSDRFGESGDFAWAEFYARLFAHVGRLESDSSTNLESRLKQIEQRVNARGESIDVERVLAMLYYQSMLFAVPTVPPEKGIRLFEFIDPRFADAVSDIDADMADDWTILYRYIIEQTVGRWETSETEPLLEQVTAAIRRHSDTSAAAARQLAELYAGAIDALLRDRTIARRLQDGVEADDWVTLINEHARSIAPTFQKTDGTSTADAAIQGTDDSHEVAFLIRFYVNILLESARRHKEELRQLTLDEGRAVFRFVNTNIRDVGTKHGAGVLLQFYVEAVKTLLLVIDTDIQHFEALADKNPEKIPHSVMYIQQITKNLQRNLSGRYARRFYDQIQEHILREAIEGSVSIESTLRLLFIDECLWFASFANASDQDEQVQFLVKRIRSFLLLGWETKRRQAHRTEAEVGALRNQLESIKDNDPECYEKIKKCLCTKQPARVQDALEAALPEFCDKSSPSVSES